MKERDIATPRERSGWRDFIPVAGVLIISLCATWAIWSFEAARAADEGQLRFERASQIVQDDITNAMRAYGQALRGGVGLFHASQQVSRDEWGQYVRDLAMSETYPGIQGIGYNAIIRGAEAKQTFEAYIRATDRPDFSIRPDGDRSLYVPVLYLEPLDFRNERAVGFDIYSETLRRMATDRAIETGTPSMTAKITLVQDDTDTGDTDVQSGVLLVLPVFEGGALPFTSAVRNAPATGLIVGVFRIGDLVSAVLAKRVGPTGQMVGVYLYDSPAADQDALLYADEYGIGAVASEAKFTTTAQLTLYGREWTLRTVSTPAFEAAVVSYSPSIVAATGLVLSLLLATLAWGQALRTRDSALATASLAVNQSHIQHLMLEVNHRSMNLLALIQAIARQTASSGSDQFLERFSDRVGALAANQDLLVRNDWKGAFISELVVSQLAHF